MLQSKLFAKTQKKIPREAETISHQLLLRGDFIDQLASGIYTFLPLGWRVHQKIESLIRQEMSSLGAQEISMPVLQPRTLWEETGRWQSYVPPLFKLKDRHQKDFALGPTHEEVVTDLVRDRVHSYKDLPLGLYQIQTKFRNEARPTGGLLRTREFSMKDLYSFHASEKCFNEFYNKVTEAYFRIFKRCGLKVLMVEADPGSIGGSESHEFMFLAETGEDKVVVCSNCHFAANFELVGRISICPSCHKKSLTIQNAIEGSHTFKLGDKYSRLMGAVFTDKDGLKKPIIMGCYGIGLGRLMGTIVEARHDDKGIIWPQEVAPFQIHLLAFHSPDNSTYKRCQRLYQKLQTLGLEVLYDDRKGVSAGEKLIEADILGIPWRIIASQKSLAQNKFELKKREQAKSQLVSDSLLIKRLKDNILA